MFVVCVEFVCKPEHRGNFETAVLAQAENSVAGEEACRQFDVAISPDQPDKFFLYEIYNDEPSFQEHLKSSYFIAFAAQTEDWLQSKQIKTWTRIAGNQ